MTLDPYDFSAAIFGPAPWALLDVPLNLVDDRLGRLGRLDRCAGLSSGV